MSVCACVCQDAEHPLNVEPLQALAVHLVVYVGYSFVQRKIEASYKVHRRKLEDAKDFMPQHAKPLAQGSMKRVFADGEKGATSSFRLRHQALKALGNSSSSTSSSLCLQGRALERGKGAETPQCQSRCRTYVQVRMAVQVEKGISSCSNPYSPIYL